MPRSWKGQGNLSSASSQDEINQHFAERQAEKKSSLSGREIASIELAMFEFIKKSYIPLGYSEKWTSDRGFYAPWSGVNPDGSSKTYRETQEVGFQWTGTGIQTKALELGWSGKLLYDQYGSLLNDSPEIFQYKGIKFPVTDNKIVVGIEVRTQKLMSFSSLEESEKYWVKKVEEIQLNDPEINSKIDFLIQSCE